MNPRLNAVVVLRPEEARRDAQRADATIAAGAKVGPLHFCGVAGLKPTAGRVPRTGHAVGAEGYLQSLTHLGRIARSVADLALLLRVIAGPDSRDPFVVDVPLADSRVVDLPSLRVAVHTDNGVRAPAPSVVETVSVAAAALRTAGVQTATHLPPALREVMRIDDDIYRADGHAWLHRLLQRAGTTDPGPDVRSSLHDQPMSSADFSAAIERWDAWRGQMLQWFEAYDAIVCPVNALDAVPHGAANASGAYSAFSYTFAYNMTGWPSAVVRAGTSPQGLPIGVQLVGRPWREDVVLALAAEVERALGGYRTPPIQDQQANGGLTPPWTRRRAAGLCWLQVRVRPPRVMAAGQRAHGAGAPWKYQWARGSCAVVDRSSIIRDRWAGKANRGLRPPAARSGRHQSRHLGPSSEQHQSG